MKKLCEAIIRDDLDSISKRIRHKQDLINTLIQPKEQPQLLKGRMNPNVYVSALSAAVILGKFDVVTKLIELGLDLTKVDVLFGVTSICPLNTAFLATKYYEDAEASIKCILFLSIEKGINFERTQDSLLSSIVPDRTTRAPHIPKLALDANMINALTFAALIQGDSTGFIALSQGGFKLVPEQLKTFIPEFELKGLAQRAIDFIGACNAQYKDTYTDEDTTAITHAIAQGELPKLMQDAPGTSGKEEVDEEVRVQPAPELAQLIAEVAYHAGQRTTPLLCSQVIQGRFKDDKAIQDNETERDALLETETIAFLDTLLELDSMKFLPFLIGNEAIATNLTLIAKDPSVKDTETYTKITSWFKQLERLSEPDKMIYKMAYDQQQQIAALQQQQVVLSEQVANLVAQMAKEQSSPPSEPTTTKGATFFTSS